MSNETKDVILGLILMGFPCAMIVTWVWLYFHHEELKQGLREPRDRRG